MKKYKVSFTDKNNQVFKIKIELRDTQKGQELSICSQSGQGVFNPKNEAQEKLLNLWNNYHLNGMSAGTEKQNQALKEANISGYEKACEYLKSINLYDDNGYKYGSSWLYRTLPENIEAIIENIISEIEFEASKIEGDITLSAEYQDLSDKEMALFKHLVEEDGLSKSDALEACINNDDYIVYTDEEAEEATEDAINNYLDECVFPEMKNDALKRYFNTDSFIKDAKMDGRGAWLNHYDGQEFYQVVNETDYYIYNY